MTEIEQPIRSGTRPEPITVEQVKELAAPVAREYGVDEMYVYGSVARGSNRADSDVDMVYALAPGTHMGAFALMHFTEQLEHTLGKTVSLISKAALDSMARRTESGRMLHDSISRDLTRVL